MLALGVAFGAPPAAAVPPDTRLTVVNESGPALGGMRPAVTDSARIFALTAVAKPAYLAPFADPTFGAKVTRIANNAGTPVLSGAWSSDARHHYSKDQPWNSNGTLMVIENSGGTPNRLYLDGETYAVRFSNCGSYALGDDRWHPSPAHPNERINAEGAELMWFDVVNCVKTRSWQLPFVVKGIGDGEGNPSLDGRYLALCDETRMFVVDMDPQAPYAPYPNVRIGPVYDFIADCPLAGCRLGWVSVSPSGKYLVCKYGDDHPRVFDIDPVTLALTPRPMSPTAPRCVGTAADGWTYDVGHCDMALNPFDSNQDVLIGQEHCGNRGQVVGGQLIGGVVMVRLSDGAITPLTDATHEAYPHHISTQNVDRPGWAYVGYYPTAGDKYADEILAVKMDGSHTVERMAHKHSDTSLDCYRCEAHAVPSRDGRRVVWASNWNIDCTTCGTKSNIQDYVLDLRPFAGADSSAPMTVMADASDSRDPDGTVASYRFDFGDGTIVGPQIAPRAVHTYATPGTWSVTVTATDNGGASASIASAVTVGTVNQAPNGTIDSPASDVSIAAGQSLDLAASGTDPDGDTPLAFLWTLGGGAADRNVEDPGTTVFDTPGVYSLRLTAIDARGRADPTPALRVVTVRPDRPPIVTAPASQSVNEGESLMLQVSASDPDGSPIALLSADLSGLPANHGATFTPGPGNTSGTLAWTPAAGTGAGPYVVTFTAANALSGTATTSISVTRANQAPQPRLTATPATGFAPLTVAADASASSDADGSIVSYQFEFGDGAVAGPQPQPTASHAYAAGNWTMRVTVTDDHGATATAVTPVSVRQNLTSNPSFETSTGGWNSYNGLSIARVAGGLDGAFALEMRNTTGTTVFGVNDSPNWIGQVAGVGARYRFSAWVRSVAGTGTVKLQVREYLSGVQKGVTTKSPAVVLSPSWQLATVDYVVTTAGSTLDFQVTDTPLVGSEIFLTDLITIQLVTADQAPAVSAPASVTAPEGSAVRIDVTAVDPDADPITSLTADLSTLPAGAGASFTPLPGNTSGTLTWSPGFAHAGGPYTLRFTAANALSGTTTTALTITNVDRAPVLVAPPAVGGDEGAPIAVAVTVSDPDGEAIGSLTANLSGLPAGANATFTPAAGNGSGTLSWTPGFAHAGGPYVVTFTAANARSVSASTAITVENVDRAPTITAPASVSGEEGVPLALHVEAADPDGEAIGSLELDASDLPEGNNAVIESGHDHSAGTLAWTPGFADGGRTYRVRVVAANSVADTAEVTIAVANVDRPPAVTAPDTLVTAENTPIALGVTALDPDGEAVASLTADLSRLPSGSGANFSAAADAGSGTLSWTPAPGVRGDFEVPFTATNALTGTATTVIRITHLDRPPVLTAPEAVSGREDSLLTVTIAAVDPDGEPIDSLGVDLSALPPGAGAVFTPTADRSAGTLAWTPGFAHAGSYSVTFFAGNGSSATATTALTIANLDRAPIVTAPLAPSAAEGETLVVTVTATDPDGEPIASLVADLAALPAASGAVFTSAADHLSGTLTWATGFAHAGSYPVVFTAANARSASDTATLVIVNTVREPVVLAPAAATAAEGETLRVTVTASDPDGEPIADLTADLAALPAGSGAVFTPAADHGSGTLVWATGFAHAGSYDVTFTAANADTGSRTTTITIANTDRAPLVVAPATSAVAEGDTLVVTVTATDPDGEPIAGLTADLAALPSDAGAVFTPAADHASGTLRWVPGFAHAGSWPVHFTATNAASGSATTSIAVTNVDRAPVVTAPATLSAAAGEPLTFEVSVADPDGEPIASLDADLAATPGASFVATPDHRGGTFQWTPGEALVGGPYEVTFTAANARAATATTSITVHHVDHDPTVTAPATASVNEGQPVVVEVQAGDPDGDPIATLTADLSELPAGSNAQFVTAADRTSGTLSWTPSFTAGTASYRVTFTAANGRTASAVTTIAVADVDRPPVVTAPATVTGSEGTEIVIAVTAVDPDGVAIASLTADLSALPVGSGATFTTSADRSSGTLRWTPNFAMAGGPYDVVFRAANGATTSATTRITVQDVDRNPVVTAPSSRNVNEGATVTFSVTAADPDGQPITALTMDTSLLPPDANPSFVVAADHLSGTFSWTPTFQDGGGPHRVTFTATNASSGSATTAITVGNVNTDPQVTAPTSVSGAEGSPLVIDVTADDQDGDPILSLTADLSGLPAGSNATFTAAADQRSGTLRWTPTYDDAGTWYVTFRAANNRISLLGTTITVAAVDRPPVITAPPTALATEGAALSLHVTVSDPDGQAITSLSADVSALPFGSGPVFTAAPDRASGTLTWTPGFADAGGPYPVTFTAFSGRTATATTAISVADSNRAPQVTAPATASGVENQLLTVSVTASDPDGEAIASLVADLSGLPSGAAASFTPAADRASGVLSWTPGFDHAGGPYAVTFTAANSRSGGASTSITIGNSDRAPVVTAPATAGGSEGQLLTVSITAADPDGQAITTLTADLSQLPPSSNATFTPSADRSSGTLTWTPSFVHAGGPYAVTFTAGNARTGMATTAITIVNTDRAPVVVAPATASGTEGQLLTVAITAADPDGDAIATLTADLTSLPAGANASFTASANRTSGTLSWTPGFDHSGGPYDVVFTAANARSGAATTSITIADDRPPVVTAPAAVAGAEGATLTVTVTAADPDGQAIASLTADLSALPAGSGASFVAAADHASGTLTWTPGFTHAGGPYAVTFTASNTRTGTASSAITIANTDRAPVVVAPATASGTEGTAITVNVTASDPDGDAIGTLAADLSGLPAGNNATFTPAAGNGSGTLTWTPTLADGRATPYGVTFRATNALTGTATTAITARDSNKPPVAALTVTPASGAAPLLVTANAAASRDSDGTIVSYLFRFGDGATVGPQSGASATHTYSTAGSYTARVIVTDDLGAVDSAAVAVSVTSNLVGNPGFETNTSGWIAYGSATLSRVSGGHSGGFALQVRTGSSTSGANDSPNWVATVTGVGARYRFGAWVRSASNIGQAYLSVREFAGSSQRGTTVESTRLRLSPTWQFLTVDYVVTTAGTTLDLRILDTRVASSETFLVDDVSIEPIPVADRAPVVTAPTTATVVQDSPLTLTVTATDPDGQAIASLTADLSGLPAGHNAVFTPNGSNTSGTLTWTPTAAMVRAAPYNVIFTATNALTGRDTTAVTVTAPAPPTSNLCGNPGFETNTTGWMSYGTATLSRVSGGHSGSFCLQMVNSAASSYGCDDNPNWVASVPAIGTQYRFTAWVRAPVSTQLVKLRVYEFVGTTQIGATIYSQVVALSPTWQQLTANFTSQRAGSTLSFRITAEANTTSLALQADDIEIVQTSGAAAVASIATKEGANVAPDPGARAFATVALGPDAGAWWSVQIQGVDDSRVGTDAAQAIVLRLGDDTVRAPADRLAVGCDADNDGREEITARFPTAVLRERIGARAGSDPIPAWIVFDAGTPGALELPLRIEAAPVQFAVAFGPNPMSDRGTLRFSLSRPGPVRARLFDAQGRAVRDLIDASRMTAGAHSIAVDGRAGGTRLEPGLYFWRFESGEGVRSGRVLLIR